MPLPHRVAGERQLSNGDSVYIKTLNTGQRREVQEAADLAGATAIFPYGGKKPALEILRQRVEDMSSEERAKHVLENRVLAGDFRLAAEEKYPEPARLIRDEEKIEDFAAQVEKRQAIMEGLEDQREEFALKLYNDAYADFQKLTAKTQIERCITAIKERKYRTEYNRCFNAETIYRAFRRANDHMEPYFESAAIIMDLDDEDITALIDLYVTIDSVRPEEIPT